MSTDAQVRLLKKRAKRVGLELLLALLNTSLILMIVAAILVIVATSKVRHLAKDVAADATEEVVKLAGTKIHDVVSKIEDIDGQLRQVRYDLETIADHPQIGLSIDKKELDYVNANIDSLANIVKDVKTEAVNFVSEAEGYLKLATSEINGVHRELLQLHRELSKFLEKQDLELTANVKNVNKELLANMQGLSSRIESLAGSNQKITDQTIEAIGAVLTESIIDIKNCRAISMSSVGK